MALPTLQRKLFQNDGYGPLLKDEIVSKHISVQDWSNAYDYPVATVARGSDGVLYYSKLQSGPGTGAGAVDPTTDDGTYWTAPKVPTAAFGDVSQSIASTEWVDNFIRNQPYSFHVDPVNGNDENDGLTAATAKRTTNAVRDFIRSNVFSQAYVEVFLHSGTYNGVENEISGVPGVIIGYYPTGGAIATFNSSLVATDNVRIVFGGGGGTIKFINNAHIRVGYGAIAQIANGSTIEFNNLNTGQAFYIYTGGQLVQKSTLTATVKFTGTCKCTDATVIVRYNSLFSLYGTVTWSGSVTGGKRYSCQGNSCMRGVGTNNVPNSSAGTCDSSSYFS